jgi:hypothetical protein
MSLFLAECPKLEGLQADVSPPSLVCWLDSAYISNSRVHGLTQTQNETRLVTKSGLCLTYGLHATEFDSDQLAKQVMTWWSK